LNNNRIRHKTAAWHKGSTITWVGDNIVGVLALLPSVFPREILVGPESVDPDGSEVIEITFPETEADTPGRAFTAFLI
jgi:hypothetical protein